MAPEAQGEDATTHDDLMAEIRVLRQWSKAAVFLAAPAIGAVLLGAIAIRDAVMKHEERLSALERADGRKDGHEARLLALEATRFTQQDGIALKAGIDSKLDVILREVRDLSARVAVAEDRQRR